MLPPRPPASPSLSVSAETVTTSGWLAGKNVEALAWLLPAATTTTMPALMAFVIAVLIALLVHPLQPRLRLMTSMVGGAGDDPVDARRRWRTGFLNRPR